MLTYTQGSSIRGLSFQPLEDPITKDKGQINRLSIFLESQQGKLLSLTRNDVGKKIGRFHWLIILWVLFALVTPTRLFGEETDKESKVVRQGSLQAESKSKPNFVLTIKDNLISLYAKDASLVEIVEEIGSRMKIEVITKIPGEKKITTKFGKLPLKAAIERLRQFTDIAYIEDSEKKEAKITKILVFPKKKGTVLSKPTKEEEGSVKPESRKGEETAKETPRPEPFKFEFDPSKFEGDKQ